MFFSKGARREEILLPVASRRCQRVGETVDTPAFITPTATKCKGTRGLPERTCRQTARREGGWCILLSAGRQQSGKEVVLRFAVLAIIGAAFAQEYRGTILCRRPSDCENASPRALRYSFLNSRVFEIRHTVCRVLPRSRGSPAERTRWSRVKPATIMYALCGRHCRAEAESHQCGSSAIGKGPRRGCTAC